MLAEIQRRKTANPLAFFTPNGKQHEFSRLESFVNVFSTGNGVGKTVGAVNIIGNLIYGPQSKWFDTPRYRDFYRPSNGRIVSTIMNVGANIIPCLKEWFPKNTYNALKAGKTYDSRFEVGNGCQFDIMTYDTDPEQFAGPTLQWIWFDEPPPNAIFGECIGRLRRGGLVIITMTPLYAGGWIFDRINDPFASSSEPWSLISAEIEDNCEDHGVRGVLKHKDIERIIAEYPEEEREARISGKPIHLMGRVYGLFDPAVHVVEETPDVGKWYVVCDPHDRKPFAIGWYLVDPTGDIYCIDEYPNESYHNLKSSNLVVEDYAQIIKKKNEDLGVTTPTYIIDARYGNRKSVQTGDTIRDEFDRHELYFINSYTDDNASVASGHDRVKQYLKYDRKKPIDSVNKPKLYVKSNCKNHLYGFLHYTYGDFRDKEKNLQEKPEEKYKDFMDLVRYVVCERPTYEEPEEVAYTPNSWNRHATSNLTSYGE